MNRAEQAKKFSKSLSLWGAFRVQRWLDKQVRLHRIRPQWLPILKTLEQGLQEVFPNNWDIHTQTTATLNGFRHSFLPVIKFPEFEITNSKSHKHLIKDLYVRLDATMTDVGKLHLASFSGLRGKLTPEEYTSGYLHSHISCVVSDFQFSRFCTGTGEVVQLMQILSHQFTEDNLKMFLLQLNNMVKWESLEGVPYKRIANIFRRGRGLGEHDLVAQGYADDIIDHIKTTKEIVFNWVLKDGKPSIVDDDTLEKAIKWKGIDPNHYYQNLLCRKDEQGNYFPLQSEVPTISQFQNKNFPFRGKLVTMELDNMVDDSRAITSEFYVHPKLKEYVKRHFEHKAAITQIRSGFIREFETSSDNARIYLESNQVPLQINQQSGVEWDTVLHS